MKCAVCAIARLENKYIREWVEHYKSLGFFLKSLTLLAVITSAVGIAIGLLQSMKELLSDKLAHLLVCIVPVVINLTISDVFLKILSFGGMVATIFVFFMQVLLN